MSQKRYLPKLRPKRQLITLQAWTIYAQEVIRFCADHVAGIGPLSILPTGSTRRQDIGPQEAEVAFLVCGVSSRKFSTVLRFGETYEPGELLKVIEEVELSNGRRAWSFGSWDPRRTWTAHCFLCPERKDIGHALFVTTGPPEFTTPIMMAYHKYNGTHVTPGWGLVDAKERKVRPSEPAIFTGVGLPFVWPSLRHTEEAIAEAEEVLRKTQEGGMG